MGSTNLPNDLCSNVSTILLSSAQKKVETKFWDSVKARLICVYIITHLSSYLTSSFKRWKDIFIQDLVNIYFQNLTWNIEMNAYEFVRSRQPFANFAFS